jgi:beta-alanine degradation protein BauB
MRLLLATVMLACFAGLNSLAQELPPPEKQAKVLFENDEVRILRFAFQPGEKGEMHTHPDNVSIPLTDGHLRVTSKEGKTTESNAKADDAKFRPALEHAVENIGDKPYEGIIVELKCKPAAKSATK